MQAIVHHRYGPPDVLRLEEVDTPQPGPGEVLVEVHAASLNPLDWRLMRGFLPSLPKRGPRLMRIGRDFAGRVVATGPDVTGLNPSDAVFGACRGSLAEFACATAAKLAPIPTGITFEQAASIPVAGLTALQGLRDKGRIRPGQTVLINGASGGVGTFAVQVARTFDTRVTGVCSSGNVDLVRSIGAERVIDYGREDFTRSGARYDLVLDCVGNHSLAALRRTLTPEGRCVGVGAAKETRKFLRNALTAAVLSPFISRQFSFFMARLVREDLMTLADLVASGRIAPVIERRYSLSETPEAVRHLESGHARGKVIVVVRPGARPPT
jgi:NADPH:quinone reductase-like Zn-dependent oxidoreductase